ncbi:DeoR/GlpR family DNA-binding transcription regulator [Devosia sp.]|uniref:DeoR/GlpR family DNA-binding transcription regulator n=1 Tax=Devosia sp. TaxID=1871048 RepID=UPI00262F247C|nr:DeoR/GlpR family DNA-binding transcription regulator [Devosia sp.]
MESSVRPEDRRERIVDLVRARRSVSVDELAESLDISRETIRRDLTELAGRRLLRKVHGGATLPELQGEGAFAVRMGERAAEKRAIARRAAELFSPGDTLFVDTGTTTLAFAEELARRHELTVITNSLGIAQIMGRAGNGHAVYLLGGAFSEDASETLGSLAVDQIGTFHAAHAVLTVGAVNETGLQDFNLEEAQIARAMLRQARVVTVLADDSKFEQHALFPIAPLGKINRLVSNAAPGAELSASLREAGVEMIVAEVSDD